MPRCALATLAIGQQYLSYWHTYCEAGWRAYAQKHDFDLVVVSDLLDRSPRGLSRPPAWQKCLILSQDFARQYDQIVLLDSDIVINSATAPKITNQVSVERVGGVISGTHIHPDLLVILLERLRGQRFEYHHDLRHWQADQNHSYEYYGLEVMPEGILQTGVLVASPMHHRELFEAVYQSEQKVETRGYEQMPLSHAILSRRLFQPIDTRFNHVFYETMAVHYPQLFDKNHADYESLAKAAVRTQFANSFFLHFAYDMQFVRYLADP